MTKTMDRPSITIFVVSVCSVDLESCLRISIRVVEGHRPIVDREIRERNLVEFEPGEGFYRTLAQAEDVSAQFILGVS